MIVVCAWCRKHLGIKEPLDDTSITHGICPTCREIERQTGEFDIAVKNNPGRYMTVRDSKGRLIEVIDQETGRINQKARSGWYWLE